MSRELYFLRSSEQKIVIDMFKIAHPNKPEDLDKYTQYYGLTTKDLGLYALVDNEIAGAIWSRKLSPEEAPRLSVAVVAKFKRSGIGTFMMEQFLQEAAALYEEIQVNINQKPKAIKFYEKFGFIDNSKTLLLSKKLEKKEVFRPSDGYDPTRWMD